MTDTPPCVENASRKVRVTRSMTMDQKGLKNNRARSRHFQWFHSQSTRCKQLVVSLGSVTHVVLHSVTHCHSSSWFAFRVNFLSFFFYFYFFFFFFFFFFFYFILFFLLFFFFFFFFFLCLCPQTDTDDSRSLS